MITEKNINKMNELLAQEEFAQKIQEVGSYENAYQLFAENGVDASYEGFVAYIDAYHKEMVEKGLLYEDRELSVEELDTANGGAHCRVCNSYVKDGFWNMYRHCFKHAWNAVMPFMDLISVGSDLSK